MAMLDEHQHKHATHNFDGIVENRDNSPPVYFTVLFYGLIVWAVVFSAFYLLSGWSSDTEYQAEMKAHEAKYQGTSPSPPVAAAVPAATGASDAKALFAAKCAMCHGADAKGGFGPNLTAEKYEYGKNRESIALSITRGRGNGKMPAFEGQLKREEIDALADYLLSLK